MIITFDLETIPTDDDDVKATIAANVTAPGKYTKEESIEKWEAEVKPGLVEQKIHETSIDGAYGAICCIGYKINENETIVLSEAERHHEYDMLYMFYAQLEHEFNKSNRDYKAELVGHNVIKYAELEAAFNLSNRDFKVTFVGHNIINFDLRFLYQRSIILGIKPPSFIPFNAKPWETDRVYDTSTQWAGVGNRVSLSKLCKVLGLEPKGAELGEHFDGSMVWDAYQRCQIDKIAMYCKGDVERTYEIYKRMTFNEGK